ncbi:hypothetical protein [Rathayibacter toxicus]|uniref:Uncharacterized protein n=1 Tax=Rathayibacter toxicus TaxID=145458 RepID=A0A2S5Y7F1_9MICO|nr:hypothetical protein [Rathayibacter toxicus]PPH23871.1 hypothetical protein C5D17_06455 [Rathayibacter toxicus]PPH57679.1 hypothetical protein C5D30_06465 [Rathayibacter toxicus]PPH60175.1 hypothetical protein C5C93_06505 [Rathayibacter toxicus]PPH87632.1 hypothetical protein C5D31_06505 [Rathayibacter toxicus]PPI15400.1 hypothetical protein C5C51_06450 [Rathayibacter toxicus]
MSAESLNEALRRAISPDAEKVLAPAGSDALDEVLLSDLYEDALGAKQTTGFITIVNGPGATLDYGCTNGSGYQNTQFNCASTPDEQLPVRFKL